VTAPWSSALLRLLADPPLDPSAEEARDRLRRELAKPEYYDANIVERVLRWIERSLNDSVETAGRTPPLTWFAATVIAVALGVAIALLVSRARGSARQRKEAAAVLTDDQVTAAELRARAEAALAAGRHEAALVDGFRALAVRQVERGRLDDTPGTTAAEVARALGGEFPTYRPRVASSAGMFDGVMYGERSATRSQAAAVLELDDELRRAR
jgi:hypothetical protein